MPTITKQKRISNYQRHGIASDIAKLYASTKWRKLRDAFLLYHPLCQMCEQEGRVKEAEEVHHIKPISKGKDELEMRALAFDPCNLMSLCSECHHRIHTELNRQKEPLE